MLPYCALEPILLEKKPSKLKWVLRVVDSGLATESKHILGAVGRPYLWSQQLLT